MKTYKNNTNILRINIVSLNAIILTIFLFLLDKSRKWVIYA